MGNVQAMDNAVADEPHQLGVPDPRIGTAAFIAVWGIAGILSTTASGVVVNPEHVMLYFLFLMAGVLLLLLTVAAQNHQPMAERAASRFDGWIRALFDKEARRA